MRETLPRFPICHPRVAAAKGSRVFAPESGILRAPGKEQTRENDRGDKPALHNAPFRMAMERSTRIVFEVVPLAHVR
jgi:hypothetical protein